MKDTTASLKKRGTLMVVSFLAVLAIIFTPVFPGVTDQKVNGLVFLDTFFNQLSKGSAYYIDDLLKEAESYANNHYAGVLHFTSPLQAQRIQGMLSINEIQADLENATVALETEFSTLMSTILQDADLMYANKGDELVEKYGTDGRSALYSWYTMLQILERDLNTNKQFADAKFVKKTVTKGVEPAYNYYGTPVKPVKEAMVLLVLALVFYIIYTIWYGFGLLYLFEGMGIKLDH